MTEPEGQPKDNSMRIVWIAGIALFILIFWVSPWFFQGGGGSGGGGDDRNCVTVGRARGILLTARFR